jgi:hypothetical protein
LACIVASVSLAQSSSGRIDNLSLNFNLDSTIEEEKPVIPILRFIDTQNPDGSYTYGYESGDGTYKIETRAANGEVQGKYGYYDPTGELREVSYGAGANRGFEPRADGLIVAPPTIHDETEEEEDGDDFAFAPTPAPARRAQTFSNFEAQDNRRVVIRKRPTQQAQQARQRPNFRQAPQQQAAPAFRSQPEAPRRASFRQAAAPVAAVPINDHRFFGHPAQNIDLSTGSFTVSYSG